MRTRIKNVLLYTKKQMARLQLRGPRRSPLPEPQNSTPGKKKPVSGLMVNAPTPTPTPTIIKCSAPHSRFHLTTPTTTRAKETEVSDFQRGVGQTRKKVDPVPSVPGKKPTVSKKVSTMRKAKKGPSASQKKK